ncbi:MAG: HAMP domain-containing histidine kinase [Spirochaetales bacterium]|nr:HAMP domain-containing histidine kinase [Spirochaetales bacterium]
MKEKTGKKTTRVIVLFSFLLFILVLSLFLLTLRQGLRYNRVLAEYEASSLSASLTEEYLSGMSLSMENLPPEAAGFGVYDDTGLSYLRLGKAPERISELHPGFAGEGLYRQNGYILVVRTSGRGRQAGRSALPGPRDRIFTLLIYDDHLTRGTVTLFVSLTVLLFIIFLGLLTGLALLYRRINRIKAEEGRNLQLIRLGQAARVLTHEIKNPLGAIRVQEKILTKKLPEELHPSLEVIGEETARISRLTDRVGEFLKNPEGRPGKIDLAAVVKDSVASFHAGIILKVDPAGSAWVFIDRDNLRSVLDNLIENALQSGGTGEGVTVTLERGRGGFTVKVADAGPGLDTSSMDRIFDLFYTTRTTGSGIGLAVVKSFVEAAGGSVTAENGLPGGAVFTVFLPECQNP